MSVLGELDGRPQPDTDPDGGLGAGPEATAGEWDWDAEWAATQADDAGGEQAATGNPPDAGPDAEPAAVPTAVPDNGDDPAEASGSAEQDVPDGGRRIRTAGRALRRPPGRRAPWLLAVAVIGAVVTGQLSSGSGDATPVTSAQEYGLGVSDASFSGGVDVAGARGEISQVEAAARLSEIAASRAAREPNFAVPTEGRLTTCFCQRWGSMHWGIDLAAPLGTPILAAADGVVLRAGPASGYGNAVYIQDADGNVQIYGHMKYYDVAAGDVVSAGDLIAKVGNQGQSTGPHLHFEIHAGGMNGKPIDPEEWLATRGLSAG